MGFDCNPERGLIFRITHISNVPWILKHEGMDCRNSHLQDPNFVRIGNAELIDKRANRPVPIGPGGMLNDYVPFYFTPFSIMMYQIHTGYGGIQRRENHEIVIFVSSVHRLVQQKVPFVFTNQHAYSVDTDFFDSVEHLDRIDWQLLKKKDFQRDLNDPGKTLRYQAETLVHRRVPLLAFFGIGCFNQAVKDELDEQLASTNAQIAVKVTPSWYY